MSAIATASHTPAPHGGGPEGEGHTSAIEPHPNIYNLNELKATVTPKERSKEVQFSTESVETLVDTLGFHYSIFSEINAKTPLPASSMHAEFLKEFSHHLPKDATADQIKHHAQEFAKSPEGLLLAMKMAEWEKATLQMSTKAFIEKAQGPDPRTYIGPERRIDANGNMSIMTNKPLTVKEWMSDFIHKKDRQTIGQRAGAQRNRLIDQDSILRTKLLGFIPQERIKNNDYYFHTNLAENVIPEKSVGFDKAQKAFLREVFPSSVALTNDEKEFLDDRLSKITAATVELYERTGYKKDLDLNYIDRAGTYIDATSLRTDIQHFRVEIGLANKNITNPREWFSKQAKELMHGLGEKVKKQLEEEQAKEANKRLLPNVDSQLTDLSKPGDPEAAEKQRKHKDKEIAERTKRLEGLQQIEETAEEIKSKNEEFNEIKTHILPGDWTDYENATREVEIAKGQQANAEARIKQLTVALEPYVKLLVIPPKGVTYSLPAAVTQIQDRLNDASKEYTDAMLKVQQEETKLTDAKRKIGEQRINDRVRLEEELQVLVQKQENLYQNHKHTITGGTSIKIDADTGRPTTVGGGATVTIENISDVEATIKKLNLEKDTITGLDKYVDYRKRIYTQLKETIKPENNEQIEQRISQLGSPEFEDAAQEQAKIYQELPDIYKRTLQVIFGPDILQSHSEAKKRFEEASLFLSPDKLLQIINKYRASLSTPLPPLNASVPGATGALDYHNASLNNMVNADFIHFARNQYAQEAIKGDLGVIPAAEHANLEAIDATVPSAPMLVMLRTPGSPLLPHLNLLVHDIYHYRDMADLTLKILIKQHGIIVYTPLQMEEAKAYAEEVDKLKKAKI
jgi:hypothetical protein